MAQRAAVDGEVEGVDEHQAAVYLAVAAHHAVACQVALVHAQVGTLMDDELVQLVERALVEQHVDALACRHAPGGVLFLDAVDAAAHGSLLVKLLKCMVDFFSCHVLVCLFVCEWWKVRR